MCRVLESVLKSSDLLLIPYFFCLIRDNLAVAVALLMQECFLEFPSRLCANKLSVLDWSDFTIFLLSNRSLVYFVCKRFLSSSENCHLHTPYLLVPVQVHGALSSPAAARHAHTITVVRPQRPLRAHYERGDLPV
jgi:hypothetical protein